MGEGLERDVAGHYANPGLAERLRAALAGAGLEGGFSIDEPAGLDEMHTGGRAETERAIAKLDISRASRVLDIGSGLGGPARFIAATAGCDVDGVDLTPDYVETARLLTERTGLSGSVRFTVASALALPFETAAFDAIVTFHAAMNIENRPRLYAEAARVAKSGAPFLIYDVLAGEAGAPVFPLPWAEQGTTSFLRDLADMRGLLDAAGFTVLEVDDRTAFAVNDIRARLSGPPAPAPDGFAPLRREGMRPRLENYLAGLEAGALAPTMILARRAA